MNNNFKRNEKLKNIFNLVAENFESVGPNYFTYFGHQLVNRSEISEGKRVLDVACGRGASVFRALKKVGETGHVVGTDYSNEMINGVEKRMKQENISNLTLLQMDAENLDFPSNHFDYAFCGLSVHFFSDPLLAIDQMYKVLKTDGKIGISSWSIKKDKNEKGIYERAYLRVFPKRMSEKNSNNNDRPDLYSKDGLTAIFSKAGFTSIDIQEESKVFYYKDKDEWWNEQSNNASRGFFERIRSTNPELFDDFKTAAYEEVEKDMEGSRVKFEAKVLYGYGLKSN
ncbi:MAG: methyltransferase domain-containing protein [Clostridiales bacterium]|nr:methyltransferase domain-containing protein [Clostridiales bacterium]